MKILVTGSTGFVGKNLIPILLKNEEIERIFLLVRNVEKAKEIFLSEKKLVYITLEDKIEENIDKVVHMASFLTSKDDKEVISDLIDSNLKFGTFLLDYIKKLSIKEFINFGTFAEYQYGNKLESAYLYAATKTAYRSILDYYSRTYNFNYFNVIPYTIYGKNDSQKKVIDYIRDSFDKEIDMTEGEQILDFIHVEDVCFFVEKLLFHEKEILNKTDFFVGTGKGISIKELSKILEKKYSKKCQINWGKLPYRKNDIMYAVALIGNNIKYLNWKSKKEVEDERDI